jgi:uncharacterized protein YbjT (DUF2867 family)
MTTVAIAGATGPIGRRLVTLLVDDPTINLRLASRNPANTGWSAAANLTVVEFDWQRPDAAAELLAGSDVLVVIPPSGHHPLATTEVLIARSRAAGVRHIVFLSTFGADLEPGFAFGRWALASERALASCGIPWTVVRPNSYMTNFTGMLRPGPDGALRAPWAEGATSFVDPDDVAAGLAAVLRDPARHAGVVYELTGPAPLTGHDVANVLSESSGTAIRYVDTPLAAVRAGMLSRGTPPPFVDALLEVHIVMSGHGRARVTDHVHRLTGRPARSLAQWAAGHLTELSAPQYA